MREQDNGDTWENRMLGKVLLEHIKEQRRARRWSLFLKFSVLLVVVFFGLSFANRDLHPPMTKQDHTALVDLRGPIGTEEEASADNIISSLREAYANKHVKGIVLRINSPGGSPVQARQIFDELRYLRAQNPDVKVYGVIEELGVSAAYLVACGADEIYADRTSLVGSIGVILESFGFVDTLKKVGAERRLYTAGKYKGMLDMFSPRTAAEDQIIEGQLKKVHEAFIENVREGRKNKLQGPEAELFTGQFWVGEDALRLGLIDGYGDLRSIARDVVKAKDIVDYTGGMGLLDRLANRIGASFSQAFSAHFGGQSPSYAVR